METNEEKELEGFLSDVNASEPQEEEEVEERVPEEEPPQEEEEEPEELEEVEALTEREKALIAQFTESSASDDSFDPSVPPTPTWTKQEYQFFKEGENIDEILADPAKINAKMAELYNDALQRATQLALEATYRGLPRTVATYAKQQIDVVNTVNDFYMQNKDLIPLKPALARVAQKIGTEHPEYTLPQLLSESAKAARTIFKLKAGAQSAPKGVSKASPSPAFAGQKGGTNRVKASNSTKGKTLEDEVMDLIS
jgi:hypothetical protein